MIDKTQLASEQVFDFSGFYVYPTPQYRTKETEKEKLRRIKWLFDTREASSNETNDENSHAQNTKTARARFIQCGIINK